MEEQHYPFPEPTQRGFPEPGQEAMPPATPHINGNGTSGRSETIGKLVAALCKAQLEFAPVVKSNINPQFRSKYADLATIIQATMPALAKNGLAIIQTPHVNGKELTMTTLLVHSSDEWISNDLTMPATMRNELTAQTIGSACTYSRRYALQSILGVAADVDDDGTEASGGGTALAAHAVATAKVATSTAVVPALFYTHHIESDLYEITGDQKLLLSYKGRLESVRQKALKGIFVDGETLENLKYEFTNAGVLFKLLKR